MYLEGMGAGPFLRAYIFTPPGSTKNGPYASVCGSLPNGCYNTGRVDMGAPVGSACLHPDPVQFDDFTKMAVYAGEHQESLREFSSVAEMTQFCSTAGVPAPVVASPTVNPSPTITQTPAPGFTVGASTSSGARRLPTGISTPSAPRMQPSPLNPEIKTRESELATLKANLCAHPNRWDQYGGVEGLRKHFAEAGLTPIEIDDVLSCVSVSQAGFSGIGLLLLIGLGIFALGGHRK